MNTANESSALEGPHRPSAEDLAAAARQEPAQSSRSRLAPCIEVIFVLREKGWSFAAITAWLERHGVQAAQSTVQRFYRSQRRRSPQENPRLPISAQPSAPSPSNSTHEAHESPIPRSSRRSGNRPKYNTDF